MSKSELIAELEHLHSTFTGVHSDVIAQGLHTRSITAEEAEALMNFAYGPTPQQVQLPKSFERGLN